MKITSPDSTHTGVDHYGATALTFVDGIADFDGDLPGGVRQYLLGAGYTIGAEFDPSAHTVEEVIAYLGDDKACISPDEWDRVKSAEAAGKNRKTIAEHEAATSGESEED
jgi:hypothetical protein